MILESAILYIKPGLASEFESAFGKLPAFCYRKGICKP